MSTSAIRRALKMRKYTYKNLILLHDLNIESNESMEIVLREMFGRRLIYISTDEVVFKGGKMRSRKWPPESENMLYLRWNLNAKIMHGVVLT